MVPVAVEIFRQVAAIGFLAEHDLPIAIGIPAIDPLVRIRHPVAVVVAIDATVAVLEFVEIFGLVGASVARVGHTVRVAVARGVRARSVAGFELSVAAEAGARGDALQASSAEARARRRTAPG
ncbi:hypothetical protein [Nannocystis pusilla]|uniref:hypothetical protein n=1 Tax=Nannocystis pusilla TaxID=889268 RepID=UPI003B79B50C